MLPLDTNTFKKLKEEDEEEGAEVTEIVIMPDNFTFFKNIRMLSSNVENILIYTIAFIMGMASSINGTYLFLFLKDFGK